MRVKKCKRFVGDPPPYYHVTACRSRAAIDLAKSGFETDGDPPVCPVCRIDGVLIRGRAVIIEPSTWSGEDVFIARGLPGTIITTERFKEVCEANGITNAVFIPAEEYSFDFYKSKDLGYYKPKDTADKRKKS